MESSSNRPSWHEFWTTLAKETSRRSACERLHVGCILVKDNRMISQGYNGYLPGCPHEQKMRDGHEMATIHAEMNTVTDCAKRGVSIKGADAYITHYPCINCMKALCASGVARVYYVEDYRNDELVSYFSEIAGVPVVKIDT